MSNVNNISDVMIHINESLDAEARTALENAVRKVEGVVSPGFNADKAHLLLVTYDTEKTTTVALLEAVRAAGYTAQLVGM
jgi:copper chaperone CopZ